jgi:hypothetical protein
VAGSSWARTKSARISAAQKAKYSTTNAGEFTRDLSAAPGERFSVGTMRAVSWLSLALLVCAVAVVIGAEWPRLSERLGMEARRKRQRARRKSQLKLLRNETDEFAASVERDLDQLPTIEDYDRRN